MIIINCLNKNNNITIKQTIILKNIADKFLLIIISLTILHITYLHLFSCQQELFSIYVVYFEFYILLYMLWYQGFLYDNLRQTVDYYYFIYKTKICNNLNIIIHLRTFMNSKFRKQTHWWINLSNFFKNGVKIENIIYFIFWNFFPQIFPP